MGKKKGDRAMRVGMYWLTMRQVDFIREYTNEWGGNYLDIGGAYMAAYGKRPVKQAKDLGSRLMSTNREVNKAIRDRLMEGRIDEMIEDGVKKRLGDPDSSRWMETVDYIAKVRGDYAPEKKLSASLSMSVEEREKEYEKMKKLLGE